MVETRAFAQELWADKDLDAVESPPPDDYPVVPLGDDYYESLLGTGENTDVSPLKVMQGVRRILDNFPKTKNTFAVSELIDRPNGAKVPQEMLELLGAWRLPDRFPNGTSNVRKYVNPHSVDARWYTPVATECECGAMMLRELDSEKYAHRSEAEHADDCLRQHRLRARARLCEQRREQVKRILYLGHSIRSMRARLGVSSSNLGQTPDDLGFDREWLDRLRRQREANTFARLAHFYPCGEIADAFDYNSETVMERIRKRTPVSPMRLTEYRRAYGYDRPHNARQ